MGLSCAGDLSNLTLYSLVEKDFMCDPVVQRRYGVHMYFRYIDDIMLITDDRPLEVIFLQAGGRDRLAHRHTIS